MHQFQSFAPQAPTVAEYAFPSVLQYLQSEWRRFERDRNEWDIEKAEMKARIAFLEGEKRGVDNTKVDLMKRVKMLEYALRQERSKYIELSNAAGVVKGTANTVLDVPLETNQANNNYSNSEALNSHVNNNSNNSNNINGSNTKTQNRVSTYSVSGVNMTQVSPTSAPDPVGRAKSREFLRICLQEISYLTSSVPQSIAMGMPSALAQPPALAQNRLVRHELEKRASAVGYNGMRGGGGKNRHSDFFPTTSNSLIHVAAGTASTVVPPPLPRSNSVPINTLQSFSKAKPAIESPPLYPDSTNIAGSLDDDNSNQTTLRQQQFPSHQNSENITSLTSTTKDSMLVASNKPRKTSDTTINAADENERHPTGLEAFQCDEAVTVMHAPLSSEQWRADLQKAGNQLNQSINEKKKSEKSENVDQLSKDIQDKYNITSEQLSRMVKGWEWDKSTQEEVAVKNGPYKKKIQDELASLNVSEAESLGNGGATKHLDVVRSIAFHPKDKALLSGSEDGTMKYWNLESALKESKRPLNGEVEAVHTYRGHIKPITAVAISADQNKCFSASMDSTVRSWRLVSMDKNTYARQDPTLTMSSFIGHTDTVWDIKLFPLSISSSQLLASISADGTLKVWDTETKGSPLRSSWGYNGLESSDPTTYTSGLTKLPTPTGLDFCPTDLTKMVVSYSNAVVKLFDIESGKTILALKSDESYDGTTATQINKLVCHPTMPVVISGHEDRYIRFFDINSGSCSFSMLSHLDAVSSLDIDPSGLVLCSGGHDGSVRLWDIASSGRSCLQEFTGHRRKSDEGVTSVKYHTTVPGLLATGGADSIVKVYTKS
ncbi:hypothetical protein BX616_001913 [Lobosporangium transversale]|nr:hypothetical protein BX616_001913 [Lobosporangium transversale]